MALAAAMMEATMATVEKRIVESVSGGSGMDDVI